MDDSNILVIVLFVIVSVLLVIDILVAVTIYRILKRVQHVVDKAEKTVSNIADVSKFATKLSVPMAISKIVKATAERFNDEKKAKKK